MTIGADLIGERRPRKPWVIAVVTAPVVSLIGALLALFQEVNGLSLVGAFAGALVLSVLGATAVAFLRGVRRRELPLWALLAALATVAWTYPAFVALIVVGCWGNDHCMS